MKRIVLILALASACSAQMLTTIAAGVPAPTGGGGGGAPTVIQSVMFHSSIAVFSQAFTLPTAPTAGHHLVISAIWGQNNPVGTLGMSDNQTGNTYNKIVSNPTTLIAVTTLWTACNIASSGSFTITVTNTGGSVPFIAVDEISGGTCTQDGTPNHYENSSGSTTSSSGSITTSNAVDIIFTSCATNFGGYNIGFAPTGSFVLPTGTYPTGSVEQGGSGLYYQTGALAYWITSAPQTTTGPFTMSNTWAPACAIMALK
jgi:hypothetical protein